MHTYETVFITLPTLTDEEENATVDTLSEIITSGGGELIYTDRMGRRRLAYPIEKQFDGVYTRFLYESEGEIPKELERRMRLSDQVLRALTVKLERGWAAAARVQAKEDEARIEAERLERERQEREAAAAPVVDTSATAEGGAPAAPPETTPPETSGEAKPTESGGTE